MKMFFAAFVIFVIAMLAMAVGVMLKRGEIRRGCSGAMDGDEMHRKCGCQTACRNRRQS